MWKQTTITVVVSVLLSVLSSLIVVKYQGHALSDTVRVKELELVDDHGAVRGVLEVRRTPEGEQWPQLILFNDAGREAITLGVGPRGRGNLMFVNNDTPMPQRAIALGYLYLDDTVPHSPSFTGWGLIVGATNTRQTLMGISDNGRLLGRIDIYTLRRRDWLLKWRYGGPLRVERVAVGEDQGFPSWSQGACRPDGSR